jgi:nucleoside-triphosphatase THEP1
MEWIVVTRTADREKIFVNANQIFAVYRNYNNKDVTIIDSVGDCENYIEVLESPEAIMNLLKGEVTE